MTNTVPGRAGLLEILSWARPHETLAEINFCKSFLDVVPGMQKDAFGNRMIRVGDAPIMWSCHVDTVASKGGLQQLKVDAFNVCSLAAGKPGMSLGADDGAGIWIMLNMIAAGRPGLYVFHRGEEQGCLGSAWIREHTPELLDGLQAAIAFDRAGWQDVITHQTYGRTCSDAFAKSMSALLNGLNPHFRYEPDNTGVYTDTNEYAGLIPECTNLSVGYRGQHGPRETLDLVHCEDLLAAMLQLDVAGLTIERDPASQADAWLSGGGFGRRSSNTDEYAEIVELYPTLAARLLKEAGIDMQTFIEATWEEDFGGHSFDYVPLSAA